MRLSQNYAVPALLGALFLRAFGEKEAAPEPVPAAPVTAHAALKAPVVSQAGAYEPSPEERVPGITRTQEELDKMAADVRTNTPQTIIPGDAPPAEAETTPAAK